MVLGKMEDVEEAFIAGEVIRDLEVLEDLNNEPQRRYHAREQAFELLSERQFMKMFRLTKDLSREVIEMVTPFMEPPSRASDLSIEAKVLAALNFYATGSYQNPVGRNSYVSMSQASVSRSLEEVTNALINEEIITNFNNWVRFPANLEEMRALRTRFYQKYQMPGVVGCIDCTHVAIVPPQGDPDHPEHIYVNRKNYHSLNVQLVCDENLRILHLNPRYPGSSHDAYIWRESNISQVMERIYRRNPNDLYYLIGDSGKAAYYKPMAMNQAPSNVLERKRSLDNLLERQRPLLAYSIMVFVSGYPMVSWLMTPLREPLQGAAEERYQNYFKTARCTIERCNGAFKGRFRCLLKDRTLHYHLVKASKIIKACAVLHNMCITRGVPELEDEDDNIILEGMMDQPIVGENVVNQDLQRARILQQNIIRIHFN